MTRFGAVHTAVRPRRSMLPAFLFVGLCWSIPIVGSGVPDCQVAFACPRSVTIHSVVVALVGLPATYAIAGILTAVADSIVDLDRSAPAVFDPSTAVRNRLLAVAGVGATTLALAGYGATYSAVGASLVLFLFGPVVALGGLVGSTAGAFGSAGGSTVVVLQAAALAFVALLQAGGWYVLAYGLDRIRDGG